MLQQNDKLFSVRFKIEMGKCGVQGQGENQGARRLTPTLEELQGSVALVGNL